MRVSGRGAGTTLDVVSVQTPSEAQDPRPDTSGLMPAFKGL